MRRTERAAYRTKFYSNLSSPTRFDEEPKKLPTPIEQVVLTMNFTVQSELRSYSCEYTLHQ